MNCPPDHKHGETSTCHSGHGCRCDDCRQAANDRQFWYRNMRRAGKYRHPNPQIDATGTRRRLQALIFMGWSTEQLGEHLGFTGSRVRQMLYEETVGKINANKVRDVYDRLWATPAPHTFHTVRTRKHARRQGWVGPLHWENIDTDPEPIGVVRDIDRSVWVLAELDHFRDSGESAHAASRALRRKPESLARLADRHDRPDLARWVEAA